MSSNGIMSEEIELELIEENMLELRKQAQADDVQDDPGYGLLMATIENCLADIQAIDKKQCKILGDVPVNVCARICASITLIDQILGMDDAIDIDFDDDDDYCDEDDDCCDEESFEDDESCKTHRGCCDHNK